MIIAEIDLIKLLMAVLVGGLIGAEREFRDKAAGFRTNILICVGATLFTMFSLKLGGAEDPVRIAASIVSGVGFLGAGVIMRDDGRVTGLTTSSTIWLAAALGMGIGGGFFSIVGLVTGIILVVLWAFPYIETFIDNAREERIYNITCVADAQKYIDLENLINSTGLKVKAHKQFKYGDNMVCQYNAFGTPKQHDRLVEKLFADQEIKEFRY